MNLTEYSHLTDEEMLRLLLGKPDLTNIEQELMFRMSLFMDYIEALEAQEYDGHIREFA